jgi:hypothetical protein
MIEHVYTKKSTSSHIHVGAQQWPLLYTRHNIKYRMMIRLHKKHAFSDSIIQAAHNTVMPYIAVTVKLLIDLV